MLKTKYLILLVFTVLLTSCNTVLRGLGIIKKPKAITVETMLDVGVSHGLQIKDIFYYVPNDTFKISYPYWPKELVGNDGFVYVFDSEGYLIEFESSCVGHPITYLEGEIDSAKFKHYPDSISVKTHLHDFLILEGWQLFAAKSPSPFDGFSGHDKTVVVFWSRWQHYFTKRNIRDVMSLNLDKDSVRLLFINADPIMEWYE